MLNASHPTPSDIMLESYNESIRKQLLPMNFKVESYSTVTSDIEGVSDTTLVMESGESRTFPVIRQNLSSLFTANEKGYCIIDAVQYKTFSGEYDGGQAQVIELLRQTTALNYPGEVVVNPALEKALAWLWITKKIYIPITEIDVISFIDDPYVDSYNKTNEKVTVAAFELIAKSDAIAFTGSVKLMYTHPIVIEGFEFTVMSPDLDSSSERFAIVINNHQDDWKLYNGDDILIASAVGNTPDVKVTVVPSGYYKAVTIELLNLKGVTRKYKVKATGNYFRLENHVAATRAVTVTRFDDTMTNYRFNLPTVDLIVPTKLPPCITSLHSMFSSCTYFNQDISMWNTSDVTTMASMFSGAVAFNQSIGSWDTSNVIDISAMFNSAKAFNQDISSWNVSKIKQFTSVFNGAVSFNQPLDTWDMSNATSLSYMFAGCKVFNQDLNRWNTVNVKSMDSLFGNSAIAFNGNISNWDTSNVTSMNYVFNAAIAFNQDISNWNVSNVTKMVGMFTNADTFNQDISSWNVSNVTNMGEMFQYCKSFNKAIGSWNVGKVTNMSYMFYQAKKFNQDLSSWCVSNIPSLPTQFSTDTVFTLPKPVWGTCPVLAA